MKSVFSPAIILGYNNNNNFVTMTVCQSRFATKIKEKQRLKVVILCSDSTRSLTNWYPLKKFTPPKTQLVRATWQSVMRPAVNHYWLFNGAAYMKTVLPTSEALFKDLKYSLADAYLASSDVLHGPHWDELGRQIFRVKTVSASESCLGQWGVGVPRKSTESSVSFSIICVNHETRQCGTC